MTPAKSYTKWKCRKGHEETTALPVVAITCPQCVPKVDGSRPLMKGVR